MAEIFVSYTWKDRDWAFWIGQELEKLGHVARIDAWEISGGGDIGKWMDEGLKRAEHVLCVISKAYLDMPHASAERRAAEWAARTGRPNFALPVRIENCELSPLHDPIKRCDLFDRDEDGARDVLAEFLTPAGRPKRPMRFPGVAVTDAKPKGAVAFPGQKAEGSPKAISNIPINVPLHFVGRDDDLAAIDAALKSKNGRAAITALHGLRGVGKTVLAAAYAEQQHNRYRATWWIRAETEPTMRADLVGLGVRLDWLPQDAPEEPALKAVLDRLRENGDSILLIYDNANNSREFEKYAPRGGAAHVIVTSNAPDWRGVAVPVEIEVWPPRIGADFLIERTGHTDDPAAALELSDALGGLPLAHEQAAAYCERLGIGLQTYASKFASTPAKFLADERAAPEQYHNGLTVSKTFVLAIEEAAKLHPAAELLIVYAALLAPEPIPLYLFSEGREAFAEPFASSIKEDGLDEAVAALRAFALVDREAIVDEHNPTIVTDCIRLHRLVRKVVLARCNDVTGKAIRLMLLTALTRVFPWTGHAAQLDRARRLDAIALAATQQSADLDEQAKSLNEKLLRFLANYRFDMGNYSEARLLYERALRISEEVHGSDGIDTARILHNLVHTLRKLRDLASARSYQERALAIVEGVRGPDHPDTALFLNNLGALLREQENFAEARSALQRALEIREQKLGINNSETASTLNSLGVLLSEQGDYAGAESYLRRALAIEEEVLGTGHPDSAHSLNNLSFALLRQNKDLAEAKRLGERGLAIREGVLGPHHPDTAISLDVLGRISFAQRDFQDAFLLFERELEINEKALGLGHMRTKIAAGNKAAALDGLGRSDEASAVRLRYPMAD